MKKISVIVPVYNAEKYIDRCIQSIIAQTYTNLEVILADDGSPDNSGAICDEWAKKDDRIRVIHKPNGGVSSARNTGLDAAMGDYIAFVDSDDTVKSNWLSDLMDMNKAFDADLITFGTEKIMDGQVINTESMPTFFASDRDELSQHFCRFFEDVFGSVCTKLYKRNIIQSFHIRFDRTLSINEDAFFDYAFIPQAIKIINCENCYYQYHYYKNSSSNKGRDDMAQVFIRRRPVHDEFVKKMGYEHIGLPTGEDMLKIGIYFQFLQATTANNSFSFSQRIRILDSLYSDSNFHKYIIEKITEQPLSLSLKLGLLSVKTKIPAIIAVPVSIKNILLRLKND